MHRRKVYPGQEVLDEDVLYSNRYALTGLARAMAAVLGVNTVVNGLGISPGAGLSVNIARGEIYTQAAIDATAYGSLASDAHTGMKQGILADILNLAVAAPGTAGQSINYLIQAQYQQVDQDLVLLPYFDAAHPDVPYSGPNGDATSNSTTRAELCVVQALAGIAAATGSQATPAATAGWTGLYVVTVANGQASIVAANIYTPLTAPLLRRNLTQIHQPANNLAYQLGNIL